jgi:hypothetical protein
MSRWYRALIESLLTNIHALEGRSPHRPPWWRRYIGDGVYPLVDAAVAGLFVGVVVCVIT